MSSERILVVDDEPGVRSALQGILEDEGFQVDCAETGEQGLERLKQHEYDALLLDVWLPGDDGLAILKTLRERNHDPAVVMISGHGTIETAVGATKLGAFDFVEKPLSLERTLLVLRNALRQRQLERTNSHLMQHLSRDTEITGESPFAKKLREDVDRAVTSESNLLIVGPFGSGRERVARRVHALGPRPDAPFVEIPVGALDDAALEAVLFGSDGNPGRLQIARGGTLFIEDADRMSAQLQDRLAARLDDDGRRGEQLRAIGSVTVASLQPALKQTLAVLSIEVPSLRRRRADLPQLVERFMRETAREYAREPKRFSPDALQRLEAWHWPGNVRELRNLIERLLLFSDHPEIDASDLPEAFFQEASQADLYGKFDSLADGVRAFERFHVERALEAAAGDHEVAAASLGLSIEELKRRAEPDERG